MQVFAGKAGDILKIYPVALRLARRRGKKAGERFDTEFWEVVNKKEMRLKFKEMKSEYDINQYIKEG